MNSRPLVWIGLSVGSLIGGYVPELWGAGMFSFASIFTSAIGGIIGIYLGFKASQ